jgi:hypothetical protein
MPKRATRRQLPGRPIRQTVLPQRFHAGHRQHLRLSPLLQLKPQRPIGAPPLIAGDPAARHARLQGAFDHRERHGVGSWLEESIASS